jgi:hypothetical protein
VCVSELQAEEDGSGRRCIHPPRRSSLRGHGRGCLPVTDSGRDRDCQGGERRRSFQVDEDVACRVRVLYNEGRGLPVERSRGIYADLGSVSFVCVVYY